MKDELDDTTLEQAALYALDSLEPADAAVFRQRLAGSARLRTEVASLQAVARQLAHAAPDETPPARLRDRVLARAHGAAPLVVRGSTDDWQPAGVTGVDVRRLFVDAEGERQTILVRMHPGAVYPVHGHNGNEECYVVEGDLRDGALEMVAGDYTCYPPGSEHGPLTTRGGCLLLVVASLHD